MLKLCLLAALFGLPAAAMAQSDPMQLARLASANQLGLMQYCQGKGWANKSAVDAQKSANASLPGGDATELTAAGLPAACRVA